MKPTCKLSVNTNTDKNNTTHAGMNQDHLNVGFIRPLKNKYLRMKYISFLLLILFVSCKSHIKNAPDEIDLFKLNHASSCVRSLDTSLFEGNEIMFTPQSENDYLLLFNDSLGATWSDSAYIIVEIWHANMHSAIIYLDFFKDRIQHSKGSSEQGKQNSKQVSHIPAIFAKIGVLPFLKTQLIFPLKYLDGQNIFLERYGRQLKGFVNGERTKLSEVTEIRLRIAPLLAPNYLTKVYIGSVSVSNTLPIPFTAPEKPYVDKFGQWNMKDWPGKIKDETDLKIKMNGLRNLIDTATFGLDYSTFGGWKKKKFNATGFFRTQFDGKRWWLVDPEGYAFISAGMDCVRNSVDGPIENRKDLFEWLPNEKDTSLGEVKLNKRGMPNFDFMKSNLKRIYANDWSVQWDSMVSKLLTYSGFNTIANWSDLRLAQKVKMPYVLPMNNFPETKLKLYRDFPDVFDPAFIIASREFAQQLIPFAEDPYLIGYFLSNEPHWAFGDHNLAHEMMKVNDQSFTKDSMILWLKQKYNNDISKLNIEWNTKLEDFETIKKSILNILPSKVCVDDLNEFSGIMVDEYVRAACSEVKKVDKNHLNLGLRYAWISSELCYRAGKAFDVFSINGYNFPGPPETAEITRRSGKPVMIGEFHFGATDRGLPANGIQGAENQKARGEAYRYYVEQGLARPELIGIHYFLLNDQLITGRFDGENYNVGILDITCQPYYDMINEVKKTHRIMYDVANGSVKPYSKIINKVPQIYY